jgi:hypothetical protein
MEAALTSVNAKACAQAVHLIRQASLGPEGFFQRGILQTLIGSQQNGKAGCHTVVIGRGAYCGAH